MSHRKSYAVKIILTITSVIFALMDFIRDRIIWLFFLT